MKSLRVAMIAPPWLSIPPRGYGGIENVIYALVPALTKLGVDVELFATGDSEVPTPSLRYVYDVAQYGNMLRPQYETGPIMSAHMLYAINRILESDFDVIHDHNNYLGPMAFAHASDKLPPVVHTLHNPSFITSKVDKEINLPTTGYMWRELAKAENMYFVSLSESMRKSAPKSIKHLLLDPVYNAVDVEKFPFVADKENHFITLSRFSPEKGVHIAIAACQELGVKLRMAGPVNNLRKKSEVMLQLANPASTYRTFVDFRYFSDTIMSNLYGRNIEYVGEVGGPDKLDFISKAKALLFPIQWDEPFGMSVIEALACGTPVISMARGALPEIIQHGYNGYLANTVSEFKKYMTMIDQIDPANCRKSVQDKFSARGMAEQYIARYKEVIEKTAKNR